MQTHAVTRRLAAILVADIAGYSRLMEIDEEGTLEQVRNLYDTLVTHAISEHRGRVVKTMGDGFLAEFASVTDAVQSAVELQERMKARNETRHEDAPIMYRVGINLGEIIFEADDIYGTGVNVAARLEELAEPGGIRISGSVYDQIRSILNLGYRDKGEMTVKNISAPVRSFSVVIDSDGSDQSGVDAVMVNGRKSDKISITVLPFENLSRDSEQEYFADGMTEDITTALSKNRWLLVSARNSAFAYKGQTIDVRQVARELGSDFVLEGSVRRAGNRIRVSAQLIDASDGNNLWAERYDRDLDDIFEVQDDITATIAAQIEPELGAAARDRVQNKPAVDLNAWDTYHLALSKTYKYEKDSNAEAQALFREAIAKDPSFAAAHAGLAYSLFLGMVYFGMEMEASIIAEALSLAQTAVALDDKDANSYFVLGRIHLIMRQYDQSIFDLRTAIDLNPSMATAYCGLADSLSYSGRTAEAIPHFEEAVRLGPHDPRKWAFLTYGSLALMLLGRLDEALEWAKRAVATPNATFWANAQLVAVNVKAGHMDEATTAARELLVIEPGFSSRRFVEHFLSYHENTDQVEVFFGLLQEAGLPE